MVILFGTFAGLVLNPISLGLLAILGGWHNGVPRSNSLRMKIRRLRGLGYPARF